MKSIERALIPAFITLALTAGSALGQTKTLKEQLLGTWEFVGSNSKSPDGSPQWGATPKGQITFVADGGYSNFLMRSGIPKFASNNRSVTTAAEDKAVVQGLIATFGKYDVDEAAKSYTIHVVGSTFPNWNGTVQRRPFTLTGDELRWVTPGSNGGTAEVVLRRAQ
jgi:Flp pilus assembly pilin Flp